MKNIGLRSQKMMEMRQTNDPKLKSWLEIRKDSDFPIQNLPFGIFKTKYLTAVAGVAIGDHVLDLVYLHENGYLDGLGLPAGIFNQACLNDFFALGRKKITLVRNRISEIMRHDNDELKGNSAAAEIALIPMDEVQMLKPVRIPNYTDFYSSEEHATNVGSIFRDPANALLPNWKHLPVAYHGRASSIVVSGTTIHRPNGQIRTPASELPIFSPSRKLDFELEMAFIVCADTKMGQSISTQQAEDHIAGLVLFNDWSARDIQQWEYVPLGPFLGKNFASTMSPWIITLDALEPFRTPGPAQDPPVMPYLSFKGAKNFDISLEVWLQPERSGKSVICRSNMKYLYWNINQQLAHHTVNGCNVQVGDLYASGTISGSSRDSYGSMLELTWNGEKPLPMPNGGKRTWLEDGDTVILRAYAEKDGIRIGFGECSGTIAPAIENN